MFRKSICYFLAILFLTGSIILPLGDFSLISDIPNMYHNYTRITSAEELGVIDFIGDYLLHGKQIFGHNEHDKIPVKGNDVQFQHQASPSNVLINQLSITLFIAPFFILPHRSSTQVFYTSEYRNELFRPPLA